MLIRTYLWYYCDIIAIGYLDLFINKKLNIFSLILFCYNILFLFYSVIKLRGFPLILFRYKILLRMMIEPTEASTAHLPLTDELI